MSDENNTTKRASKMTVLEKYMVKAGYVRCPNVAIEKNLAGGSRWYAGGPNVPEPKNASVYVSASWVTVYRTVFFEAIGEVPGVFVGKILQKFATVADFIDWCKVNGQPSGSGLPAFSNSWD